jgi:hypothetical protein
MSGPASARIVHGQPLAVVYHYVDGRIETRPITAEELPVLDRLRRADAVVYESDEVRTRFTAISFPSGWRG